MKPGMIVANDASVEASGLKLGLKNSSPKTSAAAVV